MHHVGKHCFAWEVGQLGALASARLSHSHDKWSSRWLYNALWCCLGWLVESIVYVPWSSGVERLDREVRSGGSSLKMTLDERNGRGAGQG